MPPRPAPAMTIVLPASLHAACELELTVRNGREITGTSELALMLTCRQVTGFHLVNMAALVRANSRPEQ